MKKEDFEKLVEGYYSTDDDILEDIDCLTSPDTSKKFLASELEDLYNEALDYAMETGKEVNIKDSLDYLIRTYELVK